MFHSRSAHICAVIEEDSASFLPGLKHSASRLQKCKRFAKKLILVADTNPLSMKFFMSSSAIAAERKKQVESKSWIIHPFSTFRLYYEMWMCVIFFLCLIYMPMDASFKAFLTHDFLFDNFLCAASYLDIFLNFCTGYTLPSRDVEMRPREIAKHYVFGRYFIFDVLSSLPETPEFSTNLLYVKVSDYLAILKIVRIITFLSYLRRSLHYFKLKSFYLKLIVMVILVVHYTTCFNFFFPLIVSDLFQDNKDQYLLEKLGHERNFETFIQIYLKKMYFACSYILCIDVKLRFSEPAIHYVFAIFMYFTGKILVAFVTIILVDMYKIRNCVQFRYQARVSELNAYMKSKGFPDELQKRAHQYYRYKFAQGYFDEAEIEKFISDKLKKEIRYHDCHIFVESVTFFADIPKSVLEQILTYLKKEIYLPGDHIIKAGVVGDRMYFISSGTVSVSSPSGKEICHLTDGDYFGEISLLLPNRKTTADCTALEFCELYVLDRKSFKKCMEKEAGLYKEIQKVAKIRYAATTAIESMFIKESQQ